MSAPQRCGGLGWGAHQVSLPTLLGTALEVRGQILSPAWSPHTAQILDSNSVCTHMGVLGAAGHTGGRGSSQLWAPRPLPRVRPELTRTQGFCSETRTRSGPMTNGRKSFQIPSGKAARRRRSPSS